MTQTQDENRDPLTGVWRRAYALPKLEEAVEKCAQVALVLIDIDRMRSINETRGRDIGDETLIGIAREIETHSGAGSLVFRYGGDEFGMILYENSLEDAREVAERLRASRGENTNGKLTLSLGLAHFPTHVSTAENLLAAANLALLKTKGEGKQGGRWPDGTLYIARNRVMAIGDFLDDFPEESARFLR